MAPKYKKAKLKSALVKLQDNHQKRQRATDIKAKREAALLEGPKKQQQGQNGTAASKAQKRVKSNLPPPPYNEHDTILLVGEANFSFAKCLTLEILNRGDTITATTLDSFDAGVTVLYGVDATKLSKIKSFKGKRFTKIVFNFPHAGAGIKDQDRNVVSNQKLLRAFFESAADFLTDKDLGDSKPGEILVTIKTGQPYDLWNIKKLATGTGLLGSKTTYPFRPEQYPGYEHRRTIGFKQGVSQSGNAEVENKNPKTFVFVKILAKEADMAKEEETAILRKRKRAGEDVSDDDDE
ncbi:hypothetical protein BGZ65_007896 [Modicella reniformis]|uniref:25S rRNA (uridine-N(3))-methyltransferase BMT5-like domain-containing protein n=1 Tax=Modicella reniformis TaxID=1440133 RepID=A0A9P6JGU0_9FUNG|nr:hypothetical protein BGZ65_007896 [Modicella reniformis]